VHGLGGLGNAGNLLLKTLGQLVAGADVVIPGFQLIPFGKAAVPEQEDRLLEGGVAGQVPDRDADVFRIPFSPSIKDMRVSAATIPSRPLANVVMATPGLGDPQDWAGSRLSFDSSSLRGAEL
jgi:hypothetical protein